VVPPLHIRLRRGGAAVVDTDGLTLIVQTRRHRVSGILEDEAALGHALQQLQQWLPHYSDQTAPAMVRRLLEAFAAASITIEAMPEPSCQTWDAPVAAKG